MAIAVSHNIQMQPVIQVISDNRENEITVVKQIEPPRPILPKKTHIVYEVDLQMECEEEELTDAQRVANEAAAKQYKDAMQAITDVQQPVAQQVPVQPPRMVPTVSPHVGSVVAAAAMPTIVQTRQMPVLVSSLQAPPVVAPRATSGQQIRVCFFSLNISKKNFF